MVTKLYTKQEVADLLKIHINTVGNHVLHGRLRSTKIGRRRYFTEKHVEELIKAGEV